VQNSTKALPKYQVAEDGQIGGAQASDNTCEARGQILCYFEFPRCEQRETIKWGFKGGELPVEIF
jgi:hypothetical protein